VGGCTVIMVRLHCLFTVTTTTVQRSTFNIHLGERFILFYSLCFHILAPSPSSEYKSLSLDQLVLWATATGKQCPLWRIYFWAWHTGSQPNKKISSYMYSLYMQGTVSFLVYYARHCNWCFIHICILRLYRLKSLVCEDNNLNINNNCCFPSPILK
jgi:hypothetical protein